MKQNNAIQTQTDFEPDLLRQAHLGKNRIWLML